MDIEKLIEQLNEYFEGKELERALRLMLLPPSPRSRLKMRSCRKCTRKKK